MFSKFLNIYFVLFQRPDNCIMAGGHSKNDEGKTQEGCESKKEKKARKRKKGVYRRILSQMEFYLSDANLRHSKFLLPIYESDPWIALSIFLTFNKLAGMLYEIVEVKASEEDRVTELAKALSYVESEHIELSECKTKVGRKRPFVPGSSCDIDTCTIYAENLAPEADHDVIRNLFSSFGDIVYVSIPKFKSGRSKGFAFIEFKTAESVDKVLREFSRVAVDRSEELASVKTFLEQEVEVKQSAIGNKRKNEEGGKTVTKRVKIQEDLQEEKPEDNSCGLLDNAGSDSDIQVLSKVQWKKLRNKYLDEQRKNFGSAKNSFKKARTPHYVERQYGDDGDIKENVKESSQPVIDIKPGVVVKILLKEGVDSLPDIKRKIRAAIDDEKVAYVDARVGYDVVHVRCEDKNQAKKLAEASIGQEISKDILVGEEEKDYHLKAAKDRNDKRSGKVKVPKTKTKAKIFQKVENNKNSHVFFD